MRRIILSIAALMPGTLWADPLDRGEAYTTRQGPPPWMDNIDFGLLLVDYGIFALTLVALGWLLFKKPDYLHRLESLVRAPFAAIFAAARRAGGVTEFILQMFGGIAVLVTLAAWVFFCQWLKHIGLGALAMIGLAFVALLLVRMIKGNEKEVPVP
ncbi:MAG: hypothetical protein Q9M12_06385 [Mariprofundus sp.]|nr:hypothetical protein [Mariprofundus sp.]